MQKYGKAKNKGRRPKVCVKVGLGFDVTRGTCVLGVTCRVGARGNTVSASCRMLFDSDESIETIAEYIGYSDSKKYRKKFKEIVGVSPREYKKSLFS